MKITVLVPTYRRSKDLKRCLDALKQQIYPVDELFVTVRDTDDETYQFLQSYNYHPLPLNVLSTSRVGVVAAMNLALDHCSGDIIAITDDDAKPHADWLYQIKNHYLADKYLGAVGGRDWVYINANQEPLSAPPRALITVGRLQWIGRMIGNHHIGQGVAREVDFLKGVNSSYRIQAIQGDRFDDRLKGTGAQVHHEVGMCLSLKRRNWKIIYDPSIVVDHYPAIRFDEDQRDSFHRDAYYNAAYNQTLVLCDHLSNPRFFLYMVWIILIGTRGCFGALQAIRFLFIQKDLVLYKWMAAMLGHFHATCDGLSHRHTHKTLLISQVSIKNEAELINIES
jgi:glycosyltransferase involved in cell wall biosynthesis